MDIIKQQLDELWHFKFGGIAADGKYRLADTSQQLEPGETPEDWVADNAAAAQTLIDNGIYREDFANDTLSRQDQLGAKGWMDDNQAAILLFTLSVEDLKTEISDLIDASFPSLTAGQRNKWVLLLMVLALSVRVFARRLGLLRR